MKTSSVDVQEVAKFASLVNHWWDETGALRTLHDINPTRLLFIKQQGNLKNRRILDVGCGGGILSEAMALEGAKVTGIDAESGAIAVAKTHATESQLDIDYQCIAIENYETDPFDAITCMELLEHVASPELVLRHCARLLKPGGVLLVSTINRSWQAYTSAVLAAEYILNLLPKQTHEYAKFIKPAELAAMARGLGLELKDMRGISYNPLNHRAALQDSVAVNYVMSFVLSP